MGRRLSPRDQELYKRCDEVLHYLWDPIGVAGSPGARDEYYSYLPQVFARVRDGAEPDELVAHLTRIEEQRMGLPPNRAKARAAVDRLLEWRAWIWEQSGGD